MNTVQDPARRDATVATRRRRLAAALLIIGMAACDVATGPEPERLLGELLVESTALGGDWGWLPDGSGIVFTAPAGGAAALSTVDLVSGQARALVPAQEQPIDGLQITDPYVYFLQGSMLHRVALDGGAGPEALPASFPPGSAWSVAADHSAVVWAEADRLTRARLTTGAQDTVPTMTRIGERRLFAAPDGSGVLVVEWNAFPAVLEWTRLDTGETSETRVPCPVVEGSVVRWETGAPVLYAACVDLFVRQDLAGDTARLATIGGGRAGTWSRGLDRVSAWRRFCPRWADLTCPEAERELWIAELRETPRRIGTMVLEAQRDLEDTGPAHFSPAGDRVAFRLEAGSVHDGIRVLDLD